MIDTASLEKLIVDAFPDARVEIRDWSHFGTQDHFNLHVTSRAFEGKPLLAQHRMVYAALGEALKDGRVHAVQIKTSVPEN